MGKPKRKAVAKKPVTKKEEKVEDEVVDSSHEESPEDEVVDKKSAKNGNAEIEDEGKAGRGRGRPSKGKKAVPTPKAKDVKGKKKSAVPETAVPKKKVKSEEPEPESEEGEGGDDDEEYEVEKILNVRFKRGGKREFFIQWKGYGSKAATWEPEENLECQDLLDAFLAKAEDNDLPRARRVSSRPSTIRSTRISETRVQVGRISKANSSKQVIKVGSNSVSLNGQAIRNKVVNENQSNRNVRRLGGRGMKRAFLLSCGMAISVGAALLLSSSSTINWDGLQGHIYQYIHSLRDKLAPTP